MAKIDRAQLQEYADFAKMIAVKHGEISLRYFRTNVEIDTKADDSPVTIADRETEAALRSEITARFPKHGIIGEELGSTAPADDHEPTWVLDPIDGTKSFIAGVPLYTMLIALMYRQEPVLGLIYQPVSGELLWAATGLGAWYNDMPARVSTTTKLSDAWLMFTDATHLLSTYPDFGTRLIAKAKYTRTWGDGYGYMLVATGRADAMIDPKMNLWDVACLKPIIEEAGGKLTTIHGNPELGDSSIASNGLLHSDILALHD